MKKRLEKVICLLISAMMVVGSMPIGVLAEEVVKTPSQVENTESDSRDSIQTTDTDAPVNPDSLAIEAESTRETQAQSTTMTTADNISVAAETIETDGDYEFVVVNDEAVIVAYDSTATATALTIPETLTSGTGEKTVVTIRAGAFKDCAVLQEVIIPNSVTTIESEENNRTFAGCTNLKAVTIPSSVTEMESYIFDDATQVMITGEVNTKAQYYASEYKNITFNPMSFYVNDFKTNLASGQNINTDISLTATVTGGTGTLKYRFYYVLGSTSVTIKDWSTANTAIFTPPTRGNYTIYVQVEDSQTKTCTKTINGYKVINTPKLSEFTAGKTSPQYINENIPLTAGVEGGTGTAPFEYEISYQLGSAKTILQPFNPANTATFSTGTAGSYTFYVTVKDSQGLTATKMITDYKIYDYLKLESFMVDKVSPQELGTSLKLTALGTGGKTDCEYYFYYTLDSDPTTKIEIQNYSKTASANFAPPSAGNYKIYVDIKNASGIVIPCDPLKIIPYTIVDTPEIGSFTAIKDDGTPFYVGDTDPLKLTADEVTGGNGSCTYAFFYSIGKETTRVSIPSTVTENHTTFKPTQAGTYTLYADVTDSQGTTSTRKISNFIVYEKLVVTLTPDKPAPQNKETMVKLTANGTGGKAPYKYEFFYTPVGGTEVSLGPASTTKTASKLLNEPGIHHLRVAITDANGIEASVDLPYTIRDNSMITAFTTDRDGEAGHYLGDKIVMTAVTDTSNTGSTYQFTCMLGSKIMYTSTAGTSKVFEYTPPTVGNYTFTVTVKDTDGATDTETISGYKVMAALSAKAVKLSKTSGVIKGDTIKLTAAGTGGQTAYKYQFYYKNDSGSVTLINQTPTLEKTIGFPCDSTGIYTFYVKITDANGINNGSNYLVETASMPIKVTNPPVISGLKDVKTAGKMGTTTPYSGDTIELTATVAANTGVGALAYEFYYMQGSRKEVIPKTSPTSASFTPEAPGTYNLYVSVTDGQGSVDIEKKANYKVLPLGGTAKSVKLSKTAGVIVGETIKLTATGSGGQMPYKYQFYVNNGTGLVATGAVTEEKTYSYIIPAKTGPYTFAVEITDANNVVVCDETKSVSSAITVTNPPDLTDLTVEKEMTKGTGLTGTTAVYEDDTINLTAVKEADTGEGELTYKFEAKLGSKIEKTLTQTDNNEFVFTPTKPGIYTFTVTVTDDEGSKDTYSVKSYKVLSEVQTKSIKVSKTTGLIVGDEITLTAAGTGGQEPYKYQFYHNSALHIPIGDNTEAKTFSLNPELAGIYSFYVKITDANGVESRNTFDVSTQATYSDPPVIEELLASPVKGAAVYEGESITLTANVKSGSGLDTLSYSFYTLQGTNKVSINKTLATTNTVTFVAPSAGTYNLCVDVTDGTTTATQKITSYKILPAVAVKSLKADKTSGVNIGTPVKITATASGGKSPYSYEFYAINGNGLPETFKNYSPANTAEFVPTLDGGYTIHVKVKDANGRKCENSAVFITDFEAVDNPVINTLSTSIASSMAYVEDEITVTSEVAGGKKPYTYTYYSQLGSSAKVQLTVDTADPTKAVFKPTVAGSYKLILEIVDAENRKTNKEIKTYVVLAKPNITSFTVDKESVVKNNKVLLKVSATGGQKPYTYQFFYKKDSGTEVAIDRDYNTVNSYYFIPAEAGTYTMYVEVIDKNGQKTKKEANKTITVTETTTP